MALIQRNRLIEKLRRQFGLTTSDVGSTIADQIVGVVIVDDVSGDDVISEELPRGALGGSSSQPALGFFSKVALQNPPGSGVDLFVESVLYDGSGGNRGFAIRTLDVLPAGANAGIKGWRDLRVAGVPTGVTYDENATTSSGTLRMTASTSANNSVIVPLGLTLPPGSIVQVEARSANLGLDHTTFYWVERLTVGQ